MSMDLLVFEDSSVLTGSLTLMGFSVSKDSLMIRDSPVLRDSLTSRNSLMSTVSLMSGGLTNVAVPGVYGHNAIGTLITDTGLIGSLTIPCSLNDFRVTDISISLDVLS